MPQNRQAFPGFGSQNGGSPTGTDLQLGTESCEFCLFRGVLFNPNSI